MRDRGATRSEGGLIADIDLTEVQHSHARRILMKDTAAGSLRGMGGSEAGKACKLESLRAGSGVREACYARGSPLLHAA